MDRNLTELAAAAGARIVLRAGGTECARVERVFASDKISELLHHGAPGTLLVTGLANPHLVRAAGLVEATAICLTSGREPSAELMAAAQEHGVTLMVADGTLAETADRLGSALAGNGRGAGCGMRGAGTATATATAGGSRRTAPLGEGAEYRASCAAPATATTTPEKAEGRGQKAEAEGGGRENA